MIHRPSLSRFFVRRAAMGISVIALVLAVLPARADTLHRASLKPGEPEVLVLAKPLERTLAPGESHSYSIKLTQRQFVRVLVEQRGVNVSLSLTDPAKRKLAQIDDKQTERGVEVISLIAETSGDYFLDVISQDKGNIPGRYEIRIDQLFTATDREQKLTLANQIVSSADL